MLLHKRAVRAEHRRWADCRCMRAQAPSTHINAFQLPPHRKRLGNAPGWPHSAGSCSTWPYTTSSSASKCCSCASSGGRATGCGSGWSVMLARRLASGPPRKLTSLLISLQNEETSAAGRDGLATAAARHQAVQWEGHWHKAVTLISPRLGQSTHRPLPYPHPLTCSPRDGWRCT